MTNALATTRHYTPEEYLQFEDAALERHEYFDGQIIAMAVGSVTHSLISANVTRELGNRLKGSGCQAFDANLRLQLRPRRHFSYGDCVVCGEPQIISSAGIGEVCTNPRIVVEVLSPSTEAYDRTTKFDRYREIESFQEYVLVWQASPRVETYFRHSDGGWHIDFAIGLESSISLRSVPVKLPLSEIYTGVQFPPAPALTPTADGR